MSSVVEDFDFIAKRVRELKDARERALKEEPKKEQPDKLTAQQLDWFAKAIMNSGGAPYKKALPAPPKEDEDLGDLSGYIAKVVRDQLGVPKSSEGDYYWGPEGTFVFNGEKWLRQNS
jgi:hypothetical protein